MPEINTVTIPLEEYIELRRKADENFYLTDRLGQLDQRIINCENRMWELERKVEHNA